MEFDPYIPIQPTQGVTSTWSPYGAGALPGVPRPSEDWGKILGNFSKSLAKAFAAQEPERREEQEAEAARIVTEQESEELSSLLHESAKKGDIPAGYSPYLVKQVNKQLARKAARELEAWAVDNDGWFSDPDYRATDDDGNALSAEESTPSAVLERYKVQFLQQGFPGLMGTAEGAQIFSPLYEDIKKKYVEKANDLFTNAQMKKLGAGFSDDVSSVWTMWEQDPDATPEQLATGVKEAVQEMREAYSGLNVSLPEGSLNEAAIKPMIQSLETDIASAEDQEAVGVLAARIEVLRAINPKGSANEKESWGYMFQEDLDALEGKASRRKQALKDRGLTLGDEDNKAGGYLAEAVMGGVYDQVDEWAGQEEKPDSKSVNDWLRDYIQATYPKYSARSVNVAVGRLVPKVYDAINDAKKKEFTPVEKDVLAYNQAIVAASVATDKTDLENLALNPPEGATGDRAVAALLRLENKELKINAYAVSYASKGQGSAIYGSFENQLRGAVLNSARQLTSKPDLTERGMSEDYRLADYDLFLSREIRLLNNGIQSIASEYAGRAVEDGDPDAFTSLTSEFNSAVDKYINDSLGPALDRIESFELGGGKAPITGRPLNKPAVLSEGTFDAADPSFLGMTFDEEGAAQMALNAMSSGRDFYKTLRNDTQYSEMVNAYKELGPAMVTAANAADASTSYRGAGVDENKKPTAGMYDSFGTNDLNQNEVDARWRVASAVEAMENFSRPRRLVRLPGSAEIIINANTGVQVPEGYLNWEMFPVLGGAMWDDADTGGKYKPTRESEANKAFVDVYQRTFYPEGPEGTKRGSHQISDAEWETYATALKVWEQSPSGRVYNTLPDRVQLGEHRFLIEQRRLWKEWAKQ